MAQEDKKDVVLETGEELTLDTPGIKTELEDGIGPVDKETLPSVAEEADDEQVTSLAADEELDEEQAQEEE